MGFWSALGKIGAGIAAPFTGGASLAAIPLIDAAGKIAGGVSAGRAAGRSAEELANNRYDQTRFDAARLNLQAPGIRAGNSVRGDVLANAQPVSISGPLTGTGGRMPQISGGLSPALFSNSTRQLGGQISRDALLQQMQGPVAPTPQPQSTWLDSLLNTTGAVGLGAGVLGTLPQRKKPTVPNIPMPQGYDWSAGG